MRKVLIDTNIFIDIICQRANLPYTPSRFLPELIEQDYEIHVAATSLKDVYYCACKVIGEQASREYICDLIDLVQVNSVDKLVCHKAAHSNEPDFEDGIVRICAEDSRVEYLVTRDESAFAQSTIKAIRPWELLPQVAK